MSRRLRRLRERSVRRRQQAGGGLSDDLDNMSSRCVDPLGVTGRLGRVGELPGSPGVTVDDLDQWVVTELMLRRQTRD